MTLQSFGDSDNEGNEAALEAVGRLIAEQDPGAMVQRFVLIVEVIDSEDRWISAYTAPGAKAWDSLGLLEFGRDMERQAHRLVEDDE